MALAGAGKSSLESIFSHASIATENTGGEFMQEAQQYKVRSDQESMTERCAWPRFGPSPCPHHGLSREKVGDALLRKGWGETEQATEVRRLPFAVGGRSQRQTVEAVPTLLKFKVGPQARRANQLLPSDICQG